MITEKEEIQENLTSTRGTSLSRMRVHIEGPRAAFIECPNNGGSDEILDEFVRGWRGSRAIKG